MPGLFLYGAFLGLLPEQPEIAEKRAQHARLAGYRAMFAARSTVQWGTRANPAPLLALVPGGSCRGVVVDLSTEALEGALERWSHEEGADLVVEAGAEVGMPFRRDPARVVFRTVDPAGPGFMKPLPVERLARMAVVARGRAGTGVDYLRMLTGRLREWGLEEPAAAALWKEVEKERGERWR